MFLLINLSEKCEGFQKWLFLLAMEKRNHTIYLFKNVFSAETVCKIRKGCDHYDVWYRLLTTSECRVFPFLAFFYSFSHSKTESPYFWDGLLSLPAWTPTIIWYGLFLITNIDSSWSWHRCIPFLMKDLRILVTDFFFGGRGGWTLPQQILSFFTYKTFIYVFERHGS